MPASRTAALLALVLLAGCMETLPDATAAPEPTLHLRTSMGNITIGLYEQMVPYTVDHVERLVRSHAYDGTTFNRIVKGYDIQGGDLATAGRAAATEKVLDEFHPALRHDRPGMVSMATSGPDSGTSQFFITTAAVPSYDDRYSVFGHVVDGMDVVRSIEALPINGTTYGAPLQPVRLLSASVEPAGAFTPTRGVRLQAVTADKLTSSGHEVRFATIVTNTGNANDTFALAAAPPSGWNATFGNPRVALPAGRSWVMVVAVTPPEAATGAVSFDVVAHSESDPATQGRLTLTVRIGALGDAPAAGQRIQVEYTGLLVDGRVFDTTREAVGRDAGFTKMSSLYHRATYAPYNYTVGDGVVAGFDALVQGTRVGETTVAFVPAVRGYTDKALNDDLLYKRDLYFEVSVLP
ncbi:MAG: peptidylprolyl isomerase [Thermoplasmatota archaeon]|nr:peptidylprolyl isomerase [Halobacteriales archaeon]